MNLDRLLREFGTPLISERAILVHGLQEIFDGVYEERYERMCLADHEKAEQVPAQIAQSARAEAEGAYLRAWDIFPDPEFCALISDDVRSLFALKKQFSNSFNKFSSERLTWYEEGRFPCGYVGEFPLGKWVVA